MITPLKFVITVLFRFVKTSTLKFVTTNPLKFVITTPFRFVKIAMWIYYILNFEIRRTMAARNQIKFLFLRGNYFKEKHICTSKSKSY